MNKISSPTTRYSIASALVVITVQLLLASLVLVALSRSTAAAVCVVSAMLIGCAACQAVLETGQ